ncbi:MAG TPA: preprotein translocase subunit YajC [Actinomycetota bacterium]|nr:preprotein translocase subunit YajC [Actinomycetota bacterium]
MTLAATSSSGSSTTSALFILLLLVVVFYFLLYRPQRRRMRQHQDLVTTLSPGDEIVTIGGIKAYVKSIEGDELEIEIADGVIVRVVKQAIARKIEESHGPTDAGEDDSDAGLEEPGGPDDS